MLLAYIWIYIYKEREIRFFPPNKGKNTCCDEISHTALHFAFSPNVSGEDFSLNVYTCHYLKLLIFLLYTSSLKLSNSPLLIILKFLSTFCFVSSVKYILRRINHFEDQYNTYRNLYARECKINPNIPFSNLINNEELG